MYLQLLIRRQMSVDAADSVARQVELAQISQVLQIRNLLNLYIFPSDLIMFKQLNLTIVGQTQFLQLHQAIQSLDARQPISVPDIPINKIATEHIHKWTLTWSAISN